MRRGNGEGCLEQWGNILRSRKFSTDQESLDEAEFKNHCPNLIALPTRHLLFAKDYIMMLVRTGHTFTHLTSAARIGDQDVFYRYIVSKFRFSLSRVVDSKIFDVQKKCEVAVKLIDLVETDAIPINQL